MAEKKKPQEEKAQEGGPPEGGIALPIEWYYPEGLMSRYANYVVIQFAEHECHVSFFEIKPPLLLGTPDEVREQAKELKSVRADCVSRSIVTNELMPIFIKAMQETLESHLAKKAE